MLKSRSKGMEKPTPLTITNSNGTVDVGFMAGQWDRVCSDYLGLILS
jgi:hypothetical protein